MYYELVNDDKHLYPLSAFRNSDPQKGGGWVPKKGLNVWKCEVARFLKLTGKSVIPISFIVPRKSGGEVWQADIYPEAYAGKPALTAQEWIKGKNKDPILMSLDPAVRVDINADNKDNVQFMKKKSYEQLDEEVKRLRARVKELEEKFGLPTTLTEEDPDENIEPSVDNGGIENSADYRGDNPDTESAQSPAEEYSVENNEENKED
jgi:hypothetical protein